MLSRSRAFGYENLGFCVIQRRPRAKFFKRRDTRCEEFTDALRMGGAAIIPHLRSQAELFSRSHRVVSVDLRGHGRSDAPHQNYTMAAFAVGGDGPASDVRSHRPLLGSVVGNCCAAGGTLRLDLLILRARSVLATYSRSWY